jgi:hypothetical protein
MGLKRKRLKQETKQLTIQHELLTHKPRHCGLDPQSRLNEVPLMAASLTHSKHLKPLAP